MRVASHNPPKKNGRRFGTINGMGRRGIIAVCAIAGIAVVSAAGYFAYRGYQSAEYNAKACEVIRSQIAERGATVEVDGGSQHVAIIGDSYSTGDGIDDYRSAWPYLFAASTGDTVSVSGVGWTGFVNAGVCGDGAFAARVESVSGADVAIVQGGLNDTGSVAEVESAAAEVIDGINASRVVLLGPVDAPSVDGEEDVDRALRRAADVAGADYISALEWSLDFGPDGTHLSEQGHADYADRVAALVG